MNASPGGCPEILEALASYSEILEVYNLFKAEQICCIDEGCLIMRKDFSRPPIKIHIRHSAGVDDEHYEFVIVACFAKFPKLNLYGGYVDRDELLEVIENGGFNRPPPYLFDDGKIGDGIEEELAAGSISLTCTISRDTLTIADDYHKAVITNNCIIGDLLVIDQIQSAMIRAGHAHGATWC